MVRSGGGKPQKFDRIVAWQTTSNEWNKELFAQSMKVGSSEVAAMLNASYFEPGFVESGTENPTAITYLLPYDASYKKMGANFLGSSDDGQSKRYLLKNKVFLSTTNDVIEKATVPVVPIDG